MTVTCYSCKYETYGREKNPCAMCYGFNLWKEKVQTETQVGGNHYSKMKFQPIEFILANNLGFCEANAIKYLCRWKEKNGVEDLKKAVHYINILIEREEK